MASVKRQYVYGEKNKNIINVRTLAKGKDGTTWYSGTLDTVLSCKKGDFCFDYSGFDIYKCVKGGNPETSSWEWVCNLNNLNQITEFISKNQKEIESALNNLNTQAESLSTDVLNKVNLMLKKITDSAAYKPWWFGTREEYNAMTSDERNKYELHFIEEGT